MTTRRTFLKGAAALPLVPTLGAAGRSTEETRSARSQICTGEFHGLPPGWARYTNWQANAPRWPKIVDHQGYYWISVADLLSARLPRSQMLHGLGYCACVRHEWEVDQGVRERAKANFPLPRRESRSSLDVVPVKPVSSGASSPESRGVILSGRRIVTALIKRSIAPIRRPATRHVWD